MTTEAAATGTATAAAATQQTAGNQDDAGKVTQGAGEGNKGAEGSAPKEAGADFFADLEPDTREWLTKRDVKDAKSVAKLAHEQAKLLGNAVRIPGKDAKPEEVEEYLNKLGRPAAADKYEFKVPEKLPDELPYDGERATEFKTLAHKLGLSQKQAAEIHEWAVENAVGDFNTASEAASGRRVETAKAETAKLVKLWGPLDSDTMKANMAFADKALTLAGGQEALEAFQAAGLIGNEGGQKIIQSAPIAIMLASIGRALYKEDTVLRGDPGKMNNPFADGESFNMTEQMRLVKANRQEALAFIAAAGKKPSDFGLTA